jgi:uncharacterized protein (UPF0248 family)
MKMGLKELMNKPISDLKRYRITYFTRGENPLFKEYVMEFRNTAEGYRYIGKINGIPINVTQVRELPDYIKRKTHPVPKPEEI